MAHRDFVKLVLEHPKDFRLDFVDADLDSVRRIQPSRRLMIEDSDMPILEAYRKHVGATHQCQPPWIVGERIHELPCGLSLIGVLSEFITEFGYQPRALMEKILGLMPPYIESSHTMKKLTRQGDLLNLSGGVMVDRVGLNPVHAFLLMQAGINYDCNTYNSLGSQTGEFAGRVKQAYLPKSEQGNPDDWVVMFRNTGGEATFLAKSIAQTVTEKQEAVFYRGSFHGRFDPVLVPKEGPFAIRFPDPAVASEEESIKDLEELLNQRGKEIGVLMMEPVQGGGCYMPKHLSDGTHFYDRVRELCDMHNVLFVMDLVQVNWITGSVNPVDEAGAKTGAHLYALGKGLNEAYPLSAVLVRREHADKLKMGDWTSTHSMHWQGPSTAMGIFLIDDYLRQKQGKGILEIARPNAEYFNNKLDEIADKYNGQFGVDIQHQGMEHGFMHSLRFSNAQKKSNADYADIFVEELTKVGCYVFDTIERGPYATVKLFPPLLSTKKGLDEALMCIDYALQQTARRAA